MDTKKKKLIITLTIVFAVLAIVLGGIWWFINHTYIRSDAGLIRRDSAELVLTDKGLPSAEDLQQLTLLQQIDGRNVQLTTEQYDMMEQAVPNAEILWNVPFQGQYLPDTTEELTVSSLTDADVAVMKYFPQLQKVNADGCQDYEALMALQNTYPDLQLHYSVTIGADTYANDVTEISLTPDTLAVLAAANFDALGYLPQLASVNADGCHDYAALTALKAAHPGLNLHYIISVGGSEFPCDASEITVTDADIAELDAVLPYFTQLKAVSLEGITPDNDSIYELSQRYTDTVFNWAFQVCGVDTRSDATELILNERKGVTIDEVESNLKYFHNLEKVEMCNCGIPSEDMDAFRLRHSEVKIIWTIKIRNVQFRTDTTAFIPYHYRFNGFYDPGLTDYDMREFKYLRDMICLDLGHMNLTDLSFLYNMPNMKYLIVADNERMTDFTPIGSLKNLIYLELLVTKFKQHELFLEMPNLRDINLGSTPAYDEDVPVLKQLTWLERLWLPGTFISDEAFAELEAALPNTHCVLYAWTSTGGGWRENQNYRDMRDLLGMFYMH